MTRILNLVSIGLVFTIGSAALAQQVPQQGIPGQNQFRPDPARQIQGNAAVAGINSEISKLEQAKAKAAHDLNARQKELKTEMGKIDKMPKKIATDEFAKASQSQQGNPDFAVGVRDLVTNYMQLPADQENLLADHSVEGLKRLKEAFGNIYEQAVTDAKSAAADAAKIQSETSKRAFTVAPNSARKAVTEAELAATATAETAAQKEFLNKFAPIQKSNFKRDAKREAIALLYPKFKEPEQRNPTSSDNPGADSGGTGQKRHGDEDDDSTSEAKPNTFGFTITIPSSAKKSASTK